MTFNKRNSRVHFHLQYLMPVFVFMSTMPSTGFISLHQETIVAYPDSQVQSETGLAIEQLSVQVLLFTSRVPTETNFSSIDIDII